MQRRAVCALLIAPTKEHGVVTYKVQSMSCRSFDEGEAAIPDSCDVTR